MKLNILVGGKAGQGPNIVSEIICRGIIAKGYNVFNSREYGSLIRGGHNYNLISVSEKPIASNFSDSNIDILVCLDENTENIHKESLNKKGIVLKPVAEKGNMFYAGEVFKILDLDFKILEQELKKLAKGFEQNLKDAKEGYNKEKRRLLFPKIKRYKEIEFMSGSEAIAQATVKSGLDFYYSYPMTPATPVMEEIAQMQKEPKSKHIAIELEGEIAVINAALGSAIVGAVSMIGTSGGGFDLMTEALSLAGMAEIPIVIYLAQRPGPSTGMPTYTSQGDLNVARFGGHGEFTRVVIAPGDAKEAIQATTEALFISQKFRIPVIVLGDKHLAESKYSFINNVKIIETKSSIKPGERFNSYEHEPKTAITTDKQDLVNKNFERRIAKQKGIEEFLSKNSQEFKIHGKEDSKNLIVGWGSTKGAILDAITYNQLDAKFLQIIYIEPFSEKLKQEIKKHKPENIIVVENNASSQLSKLIAEKTCISVKNKILRYDGRPFLSDELSKELKRRLR